MSNVVIVGAQWGDEGKAKVIDYLAEQSDVIIRYQGGANAGHTVVANGEKFIFHLVPSGVMYPDKTCIVGNGVVFDAEQFLVEVNELRSKNISMDGRLWVSDLAHLVLPYHKALDKASEASMGGGKIGTTGRGIGPTYADKVSRTGIRVGDLADWPGFIRKARECFDFKKVLIEKVYNQPFDLDFDAMIETYKNLRTELLPFVTDTQQWIFNALKRKARLLFEGAQGTFLDIDHGTYPFVTSSNTVSGSALTGSGIGPTTIDHVVGIVKTYTTRVGNGPFPTELEDAVGERLRSIGSEFGATTGRPRRCGWFDSVLVRKAVEVNGLTRLALTKLDVLNTFDEIQICTHYELNGKRIDHFPSGNTLEDIKPIYETVEGWKTDICGCRKPGDLPSAAIRYIKKIQDLCHNVPVLIVSVGPDRSQTMPIEPI
jgi:adenylosuccinate synthase